MTWVMMVGAINNHTRTGTFHETTPKAANTGGTITAVGKISAKAMKGRLKTVLTNDLTSLTTATPFLGEVPTSV